MSAQLFYSAIFPVERWNHFETASEGIARTTNPMEEWHYGIQALFSMSSPNIIDFYERT